LPEETNKPVSANTEAENLEIEPLTDEDLEAVGGGALIDQEEVCSCGSTTGNCTS